MKRVGLIWDEALADYDLGDQHPLNPLRLTLTVKLMDEYDLLRPGILMKPRMATDKEIALVHTSGYIETVRESSDWGAGLHAGSGLGTEDNPIYPGMHDIAALTCGASIDAIQKVLSNECERTFSLAGGMHHAHRARAAGFSVYNDAAVAISVARESDPTLRVLYIDIDAHHGDGVQEAFYGLADVMTVSIHETGLHAFPGTGFVGDIGYGAGEGFSVNLPLPPRATDACYGLAFDSVVVELARAFAPDLIVAQLGADAHYADPQTDLGMTLPGFRSLVNDILGLADELCQGRIVCLGGGGYHIAGIVPLAWTWVLGRLLEVELCEEVPAAWREGVCELLGEEAPRTLGADDVFQVADDEEARLLEQTRAVVREAQERLFPLHGIPKKAESA